MSFERKYLVAETARFWTQRTGEHISHDDASEIIQNVSRFFGILRKWQQQKDENLSSGQQELERKERDERFCGFEDNATMPKI